MFQKQTDVISVLTEITTVSYWNTETFLWVFEQIGRRFAHDMEKLIFLNENRYSMGNSISVRLDVKIITITNMMAETIYTKSQWFSGKAM